MLAETSDEIVEEEKVFERNDRFSLKTSMSKYNNIYMNKNHISSDFISLACLHALY